MSNMKRKAPISPKEGPDTGRAQRKRVQNRFSQKCHRERLAAHARHLESVVDLIKTGDQEGDNASDRYSALLRQHMKIIEEKRALEEALFRMRKKLLSISNSAAAAADDEAIDALLCSKDRTRRQSEADSLSPAPPLDHLDTRNEEAPENVKIRSLCEALPLPKVTIDQPSGTGSRHEPQALDHSSSQQLPAPRCGSALPPINQNPDPEQPKVLVDNVAGQLTPHDQSYGWNCGSFELTFPLDYPISIAPPTKILTVTSPTNFAESILHACRKYVDLSTSGLDDGPMDSRHLAAHAWSKHAQGMNNVPQISEIAVHMLAMFSGLESYIYGVGAASTMESVVRWRLMPTFASRAAIPEPFRPTPLQYSTFDYPHLVDFINWPAIRDQLILHSQTINIDDIAREVVQNTVVDIPDRHISVNVFSLFHNSILNPSNYTLWTSNLRTSITDNQWKFLEMPVPPEPDFVSSNFDSIHPENALVQEISRRMEMGSNAPSLKGNNQTSPVDTIRVPSGNALPTVTDNLDGSCGAATQRRNEIVSRFGLDQITKWKLSKEFARKHPFLDCSSAVTAYDMVPVQSVLRPEARVH
ncbi:hypothetical protein BJ170DRAFT_425663 [Xylariales sp. AK1849]|nr:hypothetical protein BJ170DRAFT_425663 [Xylariales sp. AK1849]